MTRGQAGWYGRGAGVAVGTGLAGATGWLTSWPEYIDTAPLGLTVGAAGAVVGFAAGAWWDRRAARLEAERFERERWAGLFSDSPTQALPTQDADGGQGAELLLPQAAVVDFERAHRPHVVQIRTWCTEPEPGRVWLLAGGPGAGKTRVAMRVVQQLRGLPDQPWDCGWLRPGPGKGEAAADLADTWDRPVLIIVDDADLHDDLSALLAAAHRPRGEHAKGFRILLVAREFGAWWDYTKQKVRVSIDTAAESTWVGPLAADLQGQRVATRRAVSAFAARLEVPVRADNVVLRGLQPGTPAMLLHAAALESVLQTRDGYHAPVDVNDAVDSLLDREVERWVREARRQNLTHYPQVTEEVLRDTLVLATLVGGRDDADAALLLRHVPGLTDLTPDLAGKLLNWMRLYGVLAEYRARPHLPAVLAETLVVKALTGNPMMAGAVARLAGTPEQASYALAVLTRAAAHSPAAMTAAGLLIQADPLRLLPIAIELVRRGVGSLDPAIADALKGMTLPWDAALRLHDDAFRSSSRLSLTLIALATVLVACAPDKPRRAASLDRMCASLVMTSYLGEALKPAEDAVRLLRTLARSRADRHLPSLPGALTVLAGALHQSRRPDDAAEAAREAVKLRSDLADTDPEQHLPLLPGALTVLAAALRDSRDPSEAVTFAREAVARRRQLARTDPDRHRPLLPAALTTLASVLHQVRRDAEIQEPEHSDIDARRAEAVVLAREAVALRRELAAADPDEHLALLPGALTVLASVLYSAELWDEAIAPAREAVALRRSLANGHPDHHRPLLPAALAILACALHKSALRGEAEAYAAEAITLWESLPAAERNQRWSVFPAPLAHLSSALGARSADPAPLDIGIGQGVMLLAITDDDEVDTSWHRGEPSARRDALFESLEEIDDGRKPPYDSDDPVQGLAIMVYDAARPESALTSAREVVVHAGRDRGRVLMDGEKGAP
ncbi:tetratricopeptide repeat protein [Actinoplanes bogorensis]|uniref:Tetratricopeptide repeat protein n=1 Tax=Paractinoplanes bogorensis TaxID=1610840 RepID=A0ABS5YRQ8_9ACTN|nr:tetratricopeptide repeat protein [Actinoplanes bogorensis]MBU2666127.1 tetratricopeptide repeat protein [Actinoplanes bogorensis]